MLKHKQQQGLRGWGQDACQHSSRWFAVVQSLIKMHPHQHCCQLNYVLVSQIHCWTGLSWQSAPSCGHVNTIRTMPHNGGNFFFFSVTWCKNIGTVQHVLIISCNFWLTSMLRVQPSFLNTVHFACTVCLTSQYSTCLPLQSMNSLHNFGHILHFTSKTLPINIVCSFQ